MNKISNIQYQSIKKNFIAKTLELQKTYLKYLKLFLNISKILKSNFVMNDQNNRLVVILKFTTKFVVDFINCNIHILIAQIMGNTFDNSNIIRYIFNIEF